MEITYELIEPLIVFSEAQGSRMNVEFQLPGTDEVIQSSAQIRKDRSTGTKVKQVMTRTMAQQGRRVASQMLRRTIGGGMVGRVASVGMNTATRDIARPSGNSEYEEQMAIVDAFNKVSDHFYYDEDKGQWTKPPLPPPPKEVSPFQKQIKENPIANTYDRSIMARIMAELANADGKITDEERSYFEGAIPPELGSLESLLHGDPVSRIECEEVTAGTKGTILMFAWMISLVDLEVNPIEKELLEEYGEIFGLSSDQQARLVNAAKWQVIENSIEPDITRAELFELADSIELSHDEAERAKISMIKRIG